MTTDNQKMQEQILAEANNFARYFEQAIRLAATTGDRPKLVEFRTVAERHRDNVGAFIDEVGPDISPDVITVWQYFGEIEEAIRTALEHPGEGGDDSGEEWKKTGLTC